MSDFIGRFSNNRKILITGCEGQLGSDAAATFSPYGEILGVDINELDICNPRDVNAVVKDFEPDIIINCAAYTHVDACETDRETAWKVNVEGPKNLAYAATVCGGRLIHVSTDYVFDGEKTPPKSYTEADDTGPISYYGQTKLAGERAVVGISGRHMIVRTSWLYAITGRNFLKTMLRLALKDPGKKITVVNDQFGSPTWSYHLVLQIGKLIEINGSGIYHATAQGYCTWYDVALYFLDRMAMPHRVVPCTTEVYPTAARRPKNSILENRRLKQKGADIMPDWRHGIDGFISQFRSRLLDEVERDG